MTPGALARPHSAAFVDRWVGAYCATYGWERDGCFAIVPDLRGRPTWAAAPGLNYTHLSPAAARERAAAMAGRRFHIRVLDPEGAAEPGDPVVMRIALGARAGDPERVWRESLRGPTRTRVRRAGRDGLVAACGAAPDLRRAFLGLLARTLRRHGAPMPPASLFERLATALPVTILIVRDASGAPQAGLLAFRDGSLLWSPWVATAARPAAGAGELAYWQLLKLGCEQGCEVVDFGRSPFGSGPSRFKTKFGALPVPVTWLSDRPGSPYTRYALAQRLWRLLPGAVADRLGPPLCRRLPDY